MLAILLCPNCEKALQVPDALAGQTVQCPECRHIFEAPSSDLEMGRSRDENIEVGRPRRRFHDEREEDDDDESQLRITRRREEIDEMIARRRRVPHDGGLILALGIASIATWSCFLLGLPLGVMAWVRADSALNAMRQGQMDPSGRGMTLAGRVCGIVGTICSLGYIAVTIFMMIW